MNTKKVKLLRKYCKAFGFDLKSAKKEFQKLSKKDQVQLLLEIKQKLKEHGNK